MQAFYTTPSPSSHASSILRAALRSPTPSTPNSPVNTTTCSRMLGATAAHSPPPQPVVYLLFGLDFGASDLSSTMGDTETSQEPPHKHIRRLVLPPPPQGMATDQLYTPGEMFPPMVSRNKLGMARTLLISSKDIFGPLRHPSARYAQRRTTAADTAAHKRRRTAAWIQKLRSDLARGHLDIGIL
jgi:hypothetical protein